jgi:hypothetical protein
MSDLFSGKNQYDDNGALVTNMVTLIESGILTTSLGANTSGAISSIYDNDITTGLEIIFHTISTNYIQWDMKQKIIFKNIILYMELYSETANKVHVILQGSNNGTDWTNLATTNNIANGSNQNITASKVSYRYIKIACNSEVTDGEVTLWNIKATI